MPNTKRRAVVLHQKKVAKLLACLQDRLVTRRRWIKGSFSRGSFADPQVCMLGGVGYCHTGVPTSFEYDNRAVCDSKADAHTIHALATAICELYPERAGLGAAHKYMNEGYLTYATIVVQQFNDHKATTIEDVARVIEHAGQYDTITWNEWAF